MQAAFPSALNEQSAQPDAVSTAEYRTEPIHLHIPQRTTAAWPGGEEREKGRRPSQLRVLPLLANLPTPKCPPERKNLHLQQFATAEKSAS